MVSVPWGWLGRGGFVLARRHAYTYRCRGVVQVEEVLFLRGGMRVGIGAMGLVGSILSLFHGAPWVGVPLAHGGGIDIIDSFFPSFPLSCRHSRVWQGICMVVSNTPGTEDARTHARAVRAAVGAREVRERCEKGAGVQALAEHAQGSTGVGLPAHRHHRRFQSQPGPR